MNKKKKFLYLKGIPYAEPPIDSLRFRKPVPKTFKFPTILEAFRFGSACIQPPTLEITLPGDLKSEDCLFLNIFTPTLNSSANLPVMFYIPGGAFLWGAGSEIQISSGSLKNSYDGSQLAIRDVVVITINYRLGVFGFLYGNSSEAPGNMGFWDQAMALNWTKQNVRAFGGNPNNITLFGQSAGSMSISNHIVSNVTRNLFQRAIMQSGIHKVFSYLVENSEKGINFSEKKILFFLSLKIYFKTRKNICFERKKIWFKEL